MRRFWSGAVIVLLLVAGCDRGSRPGNIGKTAPQFVIGDGVQSVDLSQLRGHIVVLNLWASWCAPCIEELPSLLALQQQMPDLRVVGISIDEDDTVYRRFLTEHHVNLLTIRDPDGKINALYGTVQIPETYIIDRNGIIRRKLISSQNWTSSEMLRYLTKL